MIIDKTLDEAMVEAARFLKAAKELRAARKAASEHTDQWRTFTQIKERSAVRRASMDLTRKLAELRTGR